MLRGLRELAAKLGDKDIAFFMLKGDPTDTLPQLVEQTGAGLLVTDFSPLRVGRQWRTQVAERLPGSTVMVEVDAHNVVPCWVVSNKRETAARTIRPKVHKALPEFLVPFPATPTAPAAWARTPGLLQPEPVDWEGLLREVLARGADVPEVVWCVPGEAAARAALDGPAGFLSPARLALYAAKRNDPNAQALSNMSPYLHYGQIAPARAALEAAKHRARYKEAVEGFLEELVVRRELADNFCQFTPDYDNISCAAAWARESLDLHRSDPRPYSYTRAQWEEGRTHDELWNACQLEMVHLGKMHGFMRMYWAKKILEWTASPEDAIELAIYLNDKYELDGRDPNGYVGVMWS
ncbi:photolyase/cryptochrome alpha/beta domain-containing protein, partial [Haematococcus lacustris]